MSDTWFKITQESEEGSHDQVDQSLNRAIDQGRFPDLFS